MAGDEGGTIGVEVVYSPGPRQLACVRLSLPRGATLRDAVQASGLLARYPQAAASSMGIWGRLADARTVLRDRDRVEIHRPLQVDPMEARRRRHAAQGDGRKARPKRS